MHEQNQCSEEGIIKTVKITNSLGDDLEAKKVVAAKVSAEGLTQLSTTEIVRAYHIARRPRLNAKFSNLLYCRAKQPLIFCADPYPELSWTR